MRLHRPPLGQLLGPALQGDRRGTAPRRGIHLARATHRVPQRGDDHAQRPDRGHLAPLPRHRAATARRGHRAAGKPGARAVAA